MKKVKSEEKEEAKKSLFHIEASMNDLAHFLESIGGDVSDETVAQMVEEWFERNGFDLKEKTDGVAGYLRHCRAECIANKVLRDEYDQSAKRWERRYDVLEGQFRAFMERQNVTKSTGFASTIAIRGNGGPQPLVLGEYDIDSLPEEFVVVQKELDTAAVREKLNSGAKLDFAKYGERGTYVHVS